MKISILGFYLRHEVRTGGHKRYLELLDSLSKKGWNVIVIISSTISLSDYNFTAIPVKPVFRGKIIPYSVKQLFRILPSLMNLPRGNWVSIAFGETNYLSLKFSKIMKGSSILFAFRSNTYKAKDNEYIYYNKNKSLKDRFNLNKMLNIEKRITKLADIIVFQTTADRDDIFNRTNTEYKKGVIIPNSLRESWFDNQYRDKNTSKSLQKIIYLGNYDVRKGAQFLLEAFNILKERNIIIDLHLYGGGNESLKLKEYVDNNGLSGNVIVHGKLINPVSVLSEFDLMIIPSVYDSYPNVILESIFTGTPVLGSDNSGMKAILEYSELLFKTADIQDIANKIESIYKNERLYEKVHNLCQKRAVYHDFSWPSKFEEVILSL